MQDIVKLLKDQKYRKINRMMLIAGSLAEDLEMNVYAVGGCVRDLILGININDLDLMVEGDGIFFAKKLAKIIKIKKVVSFKKFGTALIPNKEFQIEVATCRSEKYNKTSRSPSSVIFTDLNDDLKRRDFTINTLAIDIKPNNFGKLFDPYNGIRDLGKNLIRTPLEPDITFSDDPLRMMRAAYFASKLGFKINTSTRESIKKKSERISIVSWERIREEFFKILMTPKPSIGLIILQKTKILKYVFPEIDLMYGMDQSPDWHHKDIFAHTLEVVDNAAKLSDKLELRFAALVHDIAKPNTRRINPKKGYTFHGHDAVGERMIGAVAKRMRLSNNLTTYLKKLTLLHLRPIALVKNEVTDSAVRRLMYSAGEELNDLMILCRADITTKNPNKVKKYLKNFDLVEYKMENVIEKDSMKSFQSPIKGKEIMDIFNLKEGKEVGIIKSKIEEAILDGKVENTYESSLEFLNSFKK